MTPDDHSGLGPWKPASLRELTSLFGPSTTSWWVAGGLAIDLAVGHNVRSHGDTDVVVLRRDQHMVQDLLVGWEWWVADPPGHLRPWATGELLPFGKHDIWCRPGPNDAWRIQIMLEESRGQQWHSRRDTRVHRPLHTLGSTARDGTPFLAPEVQLYYKAKAPQPKDEIDFTATCPVLTRPQRRWLLDAVSTTYGNHPWSLRLQD